MTYIEEYYQYLLDNPNRANHKMLVVFKKLVNDIKTPQKVSYFNETSEEQEEHTYIFDETKGNRPIEFIEKFCRHSKGKWAGKPVVLELWQKAIVQAIFGFVDEETRLRKYKKAILFVARKNGKSTLDSGLSLYMLTKDGEGGAEVYSVATKKEQAKIVWDEATRMVRQSPQLNARLKCRVTGIYYDAKESFMKALASDSNTLDGLNANFIVCDEVHAWKDKDLLDVMYDSTSTREQPLLIETSTMGTIRERVFDNEYDYCSQIIKGYEMGESLDETIIPFIYELDNPNEWDDETKWYKANPRFRNYKESKRLKG